MAIIDIENDIISQLQGNISDIKVESFQGKPKDYKLLHHKGAVLVQFLEGTYSEPAENEFIQQLGILKFGLTLFIKGIRDKNESYNYIDLIISNLTGFMPTGCGKMYLTRVGFSEEDNGIYQYAFNFSIQTEIYS